MINLKNLIDDKEKIITSLFIFLFLISHSINSILHFHECELSGFYKYFTASSVNKDVKITLVEEPYFKENNIFFDSMNFDKSSSLYVQRDNLFSRPNSIYIFPINVVSSSQKL